MFFIRQGATHKVVLGPAVAVGDGFTPVTTLDLSTADEAEAILHDNGTVVSISGYTWAAITTADGYYHLTLQSGISNTVGHLTIVVNDDSLILPLRADFTVLEEAVYDDLFASSAVGYPTAAEVRTEMDSNSTQLAAIVADTNELQTDDYPTTLATLATAAELAKVPKSDGSASWNATALGAIQSEVNDALVAYDPPTKAELDSGLDALPTATEIVNEWESQSQADPTGFHVNLIEVAGSSTNVSTIPFYSNFVGQMLEGLQIATKLSVGATGNSTTTVHLQGLSTHGDDELNNYLLAIYDNSTSEYHARWITGWAASSRLATVDALPFTPEATNDKYWVLTIRRDERIADILVDTSTTLQNELDGIQADTEDIQSRLPAALVGGRIDATVDATGMESGAVDAIWDEVLEGSYTGRQLMRAFAAALAGKVSGAGTTTITFRNTGDSKDVITATVDSNGNRSEVTLDLT